MRLAQNVFLVLMLAGIVYYFAHGFEEREKGTDFTDRYAAAQMVREGFGRQLYDFHAQERFQIRYAGRIGEYYIHPPFSQYLAEHTGISRWARLGLLSSQCVLFLPPLHVISLARHVYVSPIIPILIIFLLTSAETFRGIPRRIDGSVVVSRVPPIA